MFATTIVLAATLACASAQQFSLGDQLHRSVGKYVSLPLTLADATSAGWATNNRTCVPGRGVTLYLASSTVTPDNALALGFNPHSGLLTSISMLAVGGVSPALASGGWWEPVQGHSDWSVVTVGLRPKGDACGAQMQTSSLPLGDRVVVNPGKLDFSLPVTSSDPALAANFARGACIDKMGVHWIHDISSAPSMSWKSANFAPVVPMYDDFDGNINAIFFAVPKVQQGLLDTHNWDALPLVNKLMCQNFCDKSCTFTDSSFWSTGHVYFRDYQNKHCNKAQEDCNILGSCCPKN